MPANVLALPEFNLPAWEPKAGDLVENFGAIARVEAVDAERGLLLRAMPGQGFRASEDRWYADPARCRPVC